MAKPILFVLAWLAVVLLGGTAPVRACEGDKVRITVVVILATEGTGKVHPKLRCIASEVRKTYPRLTGFRLARMSCLSLPVGKQETIPLVARQTARVTVLQPANRDNRVRLGVRPPLMGEITYETSCGKFLPIVTPFRTDKKELLIVAIRVQPCHHE